MTQARQSKLCRAYFFSNFVGLRISCKKLTGVNFFLLDS